LERVNGKLKSKIDEQPGYENKIKSLMQENETLRKNQSEIEYRLSQEIQSKVAVYESRIRQFST
jgi:cell shape-determining protein MreC